MQEAFETYVKWILDSWMHDINTFYHHSFYWTLGITALLKAAFLLVKLAFMTAPIWSALGAGRSVIHSIFKTGKNAVEKGRAEQ